MKSDNAAVVLVVFFSTFLVFFFYFTLFFKLPTKALPPFQAKGVKRKGRQGLRWRGKSRDLFPLWRPHNKYRMEWKEVK